MRIFLGMIQCPFDFTNRFLPAHVLCKCFWHAGVPREALQLIREVCEETNAALLIVSHDPMVLDQFADCQDLAELNHAAQEVAA